MPTATPEPTIKLSELKIPDAIFKLIPHRLTVSQKLICFAQDDKSLSLATCQSQPMELLQMLAKRYDLSIKVFTAPEKDIISVLEQFSKDLQSVINKLLKDNVSYLLDEHDDLPIVKIVDTIIDSAYQDKASDIHIEPEKNDCLVRFRIDGVLHDMLMLPKFLHDRIVTRIKVLSSLRTDEHLSAQDGKMQMELENEHLDVRVSIVPVTEGEKIVMRLLSSKSREFTLTDLGMSEDDLKTLTSAFNKSYGMVLSTGPTGSGKTTSIYAILKILNAREKNLTSIEDPVEYRIIKANQIQVNVKTNLTFANGLRSILRQDPNVIFVGEIRDNETAGIAINAALTGHLVFSTLHTNDAVTAIPRLIDMQVEPFLVSSTLSVVIGQRLVRKICTTCRSPLKISKEDLSKVAPVETLEQYFKFERDETTSTFAGTGCRACRMSGYSGRVGIYEILKMSKSIRLLIQQRSDSDVILQQAKKEGMKTMLENGLKKVSQGETTLEEVLRVTKSEFL